MPVPMDQVISNLKTQMKAVDFEEAISHELGWIVNDVVTERLHAHIFWYRLLRECFANLDKSKMAEYLSNDTERNHIKNYLKSATPQKIRDIMWRMLNLQHLGNRVAVVDPEKLKLDPGDFIETYHYDDIHDTFESFMDPGKIIIRVYYSLDHTLGEGSEATLHVALLGIARKIIDDDSLPLKQQFAPVRDKYGNIIVLNNIMVAKKPKLPEINGQSKVDVKRHQKGSINLHDLTLPQFYTQESKKTLPGLWSLPRFADFGKDKRLYYEYVEGVPLQSLLNLKEFDILARLLTLKQMAQTLYYIHTMGYAHNDVKPQNVIISNRGIATIIDFGLTEKYIDSYKTLGEPLQRKIIGTPFFMSPEQVTKQSRADISINEIRYATPIKSQDELAYLRREQDSKIIVIDGIEFREVDKKYPGPKTPFFYDSYLKENFFSDEEGNVVPLTGKSDVFSLGVNILYLTTGTSHLKNPNDTKMIIKDLSNYNIEIGDIQKSLPDPLNITKGLAEGSYKEYLEQLIKDTLEQHPHRRPSAQEVAQRLRYIIWLYFGGDKTFFSTFDDECTYLKNRLYRNQ